MDRANVNMVLRKPRENFEQFSGQAPASCISFVST
jgi:hypothetical protein